MSILYQMTVGYTNSNLHFKGTNMYWCLYQALGGLYFEFNFGEKFASSKPSFFIVEING